MISQDNGGFVKSYPRTRVDCIIIISGKASQLRYPPPPVERDGIHPESGGAFTVNDLIWRFGNKEGHDGRFEVGKKKVIRVEWVERCCEEKTLLACDGWKLL